MTFEQAIQLLDSDEKALFALNHAMGIMYFDGTTVAPEQSANVRAESTGELARMAFEISTSPQRKEMLQVLMQNKDKLDAITLRRVSELNRQFERESRIPADEFVEYQMLISKADYIWHGAKENNDFASFEPYLQSIFDKLKRNALYMEPDKDPYDTVLDIYERGLTKEKCDEFFSYLKARLVPIIRQVTANAGRVDDAPIKCEYPVDVQKEFSDYIMDVMGIDKTRCILGETEHPYTTNFSKYDVRITTNYKKDMLASSMYSVIHEGGHALYELNIGDDITFTSLGTGVSMAIHESQSRFYENIIGRSRQFCSVLQPWLKKHFPVQFAGISAEDFYRMVNKSEPSLIRTEADELTYCLHIMIRYELERKMFAGTITAHNLPQEWNRLYKEYLGIDVPDDKHGVLQDSHWANGNIGYFPSYAIGSAYGAQYLQLMLKDFDLWGDVAKGDLSRINAWFRQRIWQYGCMKDPTALFESVCGSFKPEVYVNYLADKCKDVYNL